MRSKYKFIVNNSYDNARRIADYICIALMRYDYGYIKSTYIASVKLCKLKCTLDMFKKLETYRVNDDTISYYTIKIYRVRGNRKSMLSPISSKVFGKVIITDELLDALESLNQTD